MSVERDKNPASPASRDCGNTTLHSTAVLPAKMRWIVTSPGDSLAAAAIASLKSRRKVLLKFRFTNAA